MKLKKKKKTQTKQPLNFCIWRTDWWLSGVRGGINQSRGSKGKKKYINIYLTKKKMVNRFGKLKKKKKERQCPIHVPCVDGEKEAEGLTCST